EKYLSNLDLSFGSDSAFARPRDGLINVRTLQNPETADVLLGLKVRPVGDDDFAIGLRSHRLRGPKAACKLPDAGGNHLFVKGVDREAHRFIHLRRIEVVG